MTKQRVICRECETILRRIRMSMPGFAFGSLNNSDGWFIAGMTPNGYLEAIGDDPLAVLKKFSESI